MKKLLMKELLLTANPLSFVFILFALMTLLPGYPILCGGFFVCLGIFFSFQLGRECDDITYTVLLPVRKKDVVLAKYSFVLMIQMIHFAISAILTAVRMTVLCDAKPYVQNPLMNANLMYLGFLLMVYACFNIFFLGGFFKTTYKLGKPFIAFTVAAFLVIGVAETMSKVPGGQVLNATSGIHPVHLVVLAAGLVIFMGGTLLSMGHSEKCFEGIDL